jgi:hypothetical protein
MNLTIPPELERSLDELRISLVRAMSDLEGLKARHATARARVSHHQHDYTRDVTGQPTTFAPSPHTHAAYASDTHAHTYQDGQYTLKPEQNADVSRTTGGPV